MTDGDFRSAMRHRLGLSTMPANAPGGQCYCGRRLEANTTDHAMICTSLSGAMTLRHDILKNIWCRIARRAGIATSEEPVLCPIQGATAAC